jgi:PAS domain S-box-containing protein
VDGVVDYAIYTISLDGLVLSWNSGAERLKGYKQSEIIGKPYATFFTSEDRERGLPQLALATAAEKGRFESEGWRIRKDGSRFWALAIVDAVSNQDGEVIGFAKITRDITDRMEAQRKLEQAQEQLALAQKMEAVGQLSGGIAHDFNNLLMIVLGNLETAQRHVKAARDPNPNLDRALRNAMRGAQRATAVTSRLLAFSRRQPLDPKPLDVNKFLSGAADFLQRSLGERISIEVVGGLGVWQIEADPNQLESALVNLAINARDAMPGGGSITIESTNVYADEDYCRSNPELTPGQYVLICVSDDGSGMSPDVLSHAFEPFFTTKELGQGTGLGLSQVYGFVRQSGGHVKIYSEVGQGTTIKLYFPRYVRCAEPEEEAVAEAPGLADAGETILIFGRTCRKSCANLVIK